VPRALLERQVRTYLKQGAALERFWHRQVTVAMLIEEAERMAAGSRMPARLRELHAALDDDPRLILECLARPVLVDRMARQLFESDPRFHAAGRGWDEWWASVEGDLDDTPPPATGPYPVALTRPPARLATPAQEESALSGGSSLVGICVPTDAWISGTLSESAIGRHRSSHTAVWTGSLMIVWGGVSGGEVLNTGFRYNPATDTVTPVSLTGAPTARKRHTAVWTGSRMLIWGGTGLSGFVDTGASYNAVANTWTALPVTGAPSPRADHTAVWAVSSMIVWGGTSGGSLNTGAAYSPGTGVWTPLSQTNAPSPRSGHTAVWTGTEMVVWGGSAPGPLDTGARYLPGSNTWVALTTAGVPAARSGHTAVWTGDEMIVWGGQGASGPLDTGARFSLTTLTWIPVSQADAPSPRTGHTAVWNGGEMIVWGGAAGSVALASGARYDPSADGWTALPAAGAPSARSGHRAVWAGTTMIVHGGIANGEDLAGGGRYDPVADFWTPIPLTDLRPSPRMRHASVWTGNEMIVWGGTASTPTNTGARFNPATDSWSPMSTSGAPASASFSPVWTGSVMIVWNGISGGRYDPIANAWTPISMLYAPGAGSAVWTGDVMIVWNGSAGGRYDPRSDSWRRVSTAGAPPGRTGQALVWTGRRMIAWGGETTPFNYTNAGGLYDLVTDNWSPMTTAGAPSPRAGPVAIWSGSQMIVFRGGTKDTDPSYHGASDNARYDPATDTWLPMSASVPAGLAQAFDIAAVWTGGRLLVWGGWSDTIAAPECCHLYNFVYSNVGGSYDPVADVWSPLTASGAPEARAIHSGVWTGESFLVWGGLDCDFNAQACWNLDTGGVYGSDPSPDGDGDGFGSACDCDDSRASVRPGGAQICGDGLNNDCLDPSWPFVNGTNELDDDHDGLSECGGDCDDTRAATRPGAAEVCDLANNDCSDAAWPAVPPDEVDDDGDQYPVCAGAAVDCDDNNAFTWSVPSEALDLTVSASSDAVSWSAPVSPGATTVVYDLLRSSTAPGFLGASCAASDITSTTASSPPPALPGEIQYYLVRSQNGCPPPNQSLGFRSDGTPRTGRACP